MEQYFCESSGMSHINFFKKYEVSFCFRPELRKCMDISESRKVVYTILPIVSLNGRDILIGYFVRISLKLGI